MSYKLRIILEYFQPKIGRRIRIFSLGRKNNILIKKKECNEREREWKPENAYTAFSYQATYFYFVAVYLKLNENSVTQLGR